MLIIIVSLVLMVISIVVCRYGDNHYYVHDLINITSYVVSIFSTAIFIVAISFATANSITKETNFQNMLYEKQVIEYRIENKESNVVGNEMLYNDIVAFNNKLRKEKKWATNPWTNVFWNGKIASIDYIELE